LKVREPFDYMSAVVMSMRQAKTGLDRFGTDTSDVSELLYRVKKAAEDYDCAAQ
jgi:hypothetical protein